MPACFPPSLKSTSTPGVLKRLIPFICLSFLFSCQAAPIQTSHPISLTLVSLPTATTAPAATPSPSTTRTSLPEPTAATPEPWMCSPLQGVSLQQLPEMVANPFHPPPLGSDDPHQGVDFADRRPGDGVAVEGLPVQIVLNGLVAGVIADRFPYGNALLVETPLELLPERWLAQLELPTPGPTLEPRSALTCPPPPAQAWDLESRSLYLLYAHMKEKPALQAGDSVHCGQVIGAIGSSGNALNPHLHLEARAGPAGARFTGLSHYDNSATSEEMANYCLWRVSGVFQLLDPLQLLASIP